MAVASPRVSRRPGRPVGLRPLSPRRKWRAITIATLVLVPAFWSMMAGLVAMATDDADVADPGVEPAAAIAFGLAVIPFVFIVAAFLTEHANPPRAVLRAMGLSVLVGVMVTSLVGDPATGVVAGVGAGGAVALRRDDDHSGRARALAVVVAAAYTLALVQTAGGIALLPAPVFPLTAIGIADHLSERRRERERAAAGQA